MKNQQFRRASWLSFCFFLVPLIFVTIASAQPNDEAPKLITRVYKLDTKRFIQFLEKYNKDKHTYPKPIISLPVTESDFFPPDDQLKLPSKFQITGDMPARRKTIFNVVQYGGVALSNEPLSPAALNGALLDYLRTCGLPIARPQTVFFSASMEKLYIRSTSAELDLIDLSLWEFKKWD